MYALISFLLMFTATSCNLLFPKKAEASLAMNATAAHVDTSKVADPDPDPDPVPEVTFTKALMGLERIELKLANDTAQTDSETETMFNGPYTVDLLADQADQEISEAAIEPGTYTKIEMELSAQLTGGKTIIIEGTYDNDINSGVADAVPFTFQTTMTEDFKLEHAEGIVIDEEGASILVTFDLDNWITAEILAAATPESGNSIIIDKSQSKNTTQADAIEGNIEAAGELGLDANSDGIIDQV